ncbi:MAG: metallophosphoesterase, partial [Oscillospiraceae bacterium]|nr:metallophosphoesterase [Oscillospiraceae bacterium]
MENTTMFKIRTTAFMTAILLIIAVLSMTVSAHENAANDEVILTIIHINDVHGRTDAEPYIAKIASEIKGNGGNVLVLDGGDRLHGQVAANLTKGESMVRIMNAVGYDAIVPGNHDFNFGADRLVELSAKMDFPLLTANIKDNAGEVLFAPYKVFDFGDLTVGVFGISTPETPQKTSVEATAGLTFENPAAIAATMVATLQGEGCDVIIALAHLGDDESTLAENRSSVLALPGVDAVIDGHSHTLLENGNLIGENVLVAQTGGFAG